MNTIFDVKSFDRNKVRWEDYMFKYTPIEKVGNMYFKREDKFAPLGYGSINGSKLRQCIWLVNTWIKEKNIAGIVSGSVVGSPQHPFISAICKHYGIGCLICTPAKNPEAHLNLKMAQHYGAKFYPTKIGYARALQSISFKLAAKLPNHEVLETNITVDEKLNPAYRIEQFHKIGSHQVGNIPDDIETILIPAGSCNSVVSVLYGLALKAPKSLKNIVLLGIGNNGSFNLQYIPRRLEIIGKVIGLDINAKFGFKFLEGNKGEMPINLFNLNATGYCEYSDLMPYTLGDIEFHPRYEGKCMNYIEQHPDEFAPYLKGKTLFWIIGNEPKQL